LRALQGVTQGEKAQEGNLELREPRKHGLGRSEGGSSEGVRSAKAGSAAMAVSMSRSRAIESKGSVTSSTRYGIPRRVRCMKASMNVA
jgi:hypothetical protein